MTASSEPDNQNTGSKGERGRAFRGSFNCPERKSKGSLKVGSGKEQYHQAAGTVRLIKLEFQRRRKTLQQTLTETVEQARQRVIEMSPIDRRMRLDRLAYFPPASEDQVATIRPLADPNGGPVVESIPPTIKLSNLAEKQLMARVGYPHKLAGVLPSQNVMMDVNWLLQNTTKERMGMLRLVRGDEARAVLGGQYQPLDDMELLSIVSDYIPYGQVRYHSFGPVSTHMTVTVPEVWVESNEIGVESNEIGVVRRGLHIMNSEVGMRAITIEGIIWRDVCSNAMPAVGFGGADNSGIGTTTDSAGRIYVRSDKRGRALQGSKQGGWRFVHRGDPNALRAFVRDAIEDSKMEFAGLLGQWRQSMDKIVDNATEAITAVSKAERLTADDLAKVLVGYGAEKAESGERWADSVLGIGNAFTRAAQSFPDPEERYAIQVAGRQALVHLN